MVKQNKRVFGVILLKYIQFLVILLCLEDVERKRKRRNFFLPLFGLERNERK